MVFEVRPEQPGDRTAVRRVVSAAFGAVDPAHGEQLSRAWVDARRTLVEVWVLSPLSVEPGHQGGGIGTALVAAAVETARRSGVPVLFLEGSPDYYGARGFERADRRGFLPAALERTPRAAFQCVVFDGLEEWMTGQLVYPSVWWEHDAAGLRDPRLARTEERWPSVEPAEAVETRNPTG